MEFFGLLLLSGWLLADPKVEFDPSKHVESAQKQCGESYVIKENAVVDLDGNVKHFYCKIEVPRS